MNTFKRLAVVLSAAVITACGGGDGGGRQLYLSHLYTETNGTDNAIIHYARRADGTLVELHRIPTGGKGTNGFKPATGEASAPDSLFSAGSLTMSKDHRMLFAVNAGDRTVSSFAVNLDGTLTLVDRQPTTLAQPLSSLSYNDRTGTLYALHTVGPNHLRSFKVTAGKLTLNPQAASVNVPGFDNRVATQVISSPDGRFVLVDVLFNAPPVETPNGLQLTPSNAGTADGLVVFPVADDGRLGAAILNDSGGPTPFSLGFLRGSNDTFVNTLVAANGAVLSKLNSDGSVTNTPIAPVDLSLAPAGPAESCWVSMDPTNKFAYVTNFGIGTLTSFAIGPGGLKTAQGAIGFVPGDGTYRSVAGIPTSGPNDSWASEDGFLYQLYPNAKQLVAYRMTADGGLTRVASYEVPYNSTTGLVGF